MKTSKKVLALMLTTAFSLNLGVMASAAPSPEQLDALRAEIKELRETLKIEKAKHKYRKAKDVERSKEWNVHGDVRAKYAKVNHEDVMTQRLRLSIERQIGDTMRFKGRWAVMNNNEYGLSTNHSDSLYRGNTNEMYNAFSYPDFKAADNNWISDAYIEMDRVFGSTLTIGRFGHTFGATGFWSDAETCGGIDGAKASFDFREGKDNLTIGYANFGATQDYPEFPSLGAFATPGNTAYYENGDPAKAYYFSKGLGDALFITGKKNIDPDLDLYGMYLRQFAYTNRNNIMTSELTGTHYRENLPWGDGKHQLWGVGFRKRFDDNISLYGDFMQNCAFSQNQTATYLSLRYKKADMEKTGSFGLNLDWRRISAPYAQQHINTTLGGSKTPGLVTEYYSIFAGNKLSSDMTLATDNTKGFVFGFQWVPYKNLLIEGKQTLGNKYTDNGDRAPEYSSLSVSTKF